MRIRSDADESNAEAAPDWKSWVIGKIKKALLSEMRGC